MKGQYLAVESVLTFGLGLMAAIGVIGIFNSYSEGVYDTAENVEAQIVKEQVLDNMNSLRPVEGEAYINIDLPEDVSNRDYTVILDDDEIVVDVEGREYSSHLPAGDSVEGVATGEVRLRKNQEGFILEER